MLVCFGPVGPRRVPASADAGARRLCWQGPIYMPGGGAAGGVWVRQDGLHAWIGNRVGNVVWCIHRRRATGSWRCAWVANGRQRYHAPVPASSMQQSSTVLCTCNTPADVGFAGAIAWMLLGCRDGHCNSLSCFGTTRTAPPSCVGLLSTSCPDPDHKMPHAVKTSPWDPNPTCKAVRRRTCAAQLPLPFAV